MIPPRFKKPLFIILLICALNFGIKNSATLFSKNVKIDTPRGIIYTSENSVKETVEYIKNNTKDTDRIIVYPECLAVNFMTGRKSDNKFYSLIPLYVETFGENIIIKRLELVKPEYIIISNYNTSNYYYSFFGQDYAGEIYNYILKNYTLQKEFGKKVMFLVYRRG